VSIRTADPTDQLEAKISAGYEFNAREIRTEGYVSSPLTDTLGVRVAGFYSRMSGDLHNEVPQDAYLATERDRLPRNRDVSLRGTLKWDASDTFDARFKFNYARSKYAGPAQTAQFINCPFGSPQSGAVDNCRADDRIIRGSSGPVVGTLNPLFRNGEPYGRQRQILTSLEMNFRPSDEITFTSITGLYDVTLTQAENYENDYAIALPSVNLYDDTEFSQEFRVQSDYDSPINFTAGLYFADTTAKTGSHTYVFAAEASGLPALAANGLGFVPLRTPFQINNYMFKQRGQAYSAFLQTSYKPVEQVEITVGGRYSYEKKRLPWVLDGGYTDAVLGPDNRVTPLVSKDNWNDFSPEVSISYRPSQDLTLFTNYKHGFLSGGFNSSSATGIDGLDISYDPQTIKGFEAGIKAALLDRALRVNFAAYSYKVDDLQVVNFTNADSTIRNAAASKIKGVEFDFNYRTPLDGLSIHGAAAYNKATYSSFAEAPCYNGQRPVEGCSLNGAGVPVQDISGQVLPRSPKWNLNGGFAYDAPLGNDLKLGLSVDATYSSSFLTDATNAPQSRMPKYALLDASLRLGEADDLWELALIGRNLTDKYYYVAAPNVPFTGSGTGTAAGVLGDRFASVNRGREVMVRVSYKFGQ